MKAIPDSRLVARLSGPQSGVFSTADLRTAFAEPHTAAFARRIRELLRHGVLVRFTRGFYVSEEFELPVLSQRIATDSCISFETVLAQGMVIGTKPDRRVVATKVGRTRRYTACDFEIEHVCISEHLSFGYEYTNGVRYANPEKAVLDVLYFHLHGRRFAFDIYSDINHRKLDMGRVREYLRRYQNPKFVVFAERVLGIQ